MESKELRPVSSVGMFDLLKGLSMLSIILGHTAQLVVSAQHHPSAVFLETLGNIFMGAFIMAAGFGIHKRSVKRCLRQLKDMFLLPYVLTALACVLLGAINDFFLYGSLRSALEKGASLLISLLFVASEEFTLGIYVIDCGPFWFIPSLAGGWFLLNLILNITQEDRKRHLLVLLAGLIGYFGNLFAAKLEIHIPFCLFFMFVYVPFLYVGYLARERRWLEKKLPPILIVVMLACLAAFVWKRDVIYRMVMRDGYPLGIFTHSFAAVIGFGLLYLMTHINRRENRIVGLVESIGRSSIYVHCVHALECRAVPWRTLREIWPNSAGPHAAFVILVLRLAYIGFGYLLITTVKKQGGLPWLKEKLLPQRKKSA